jgi:hypothetical protein
MLFAPPCFRFNNKPPRRLNFVPPGEYGNRPEPGFFIHHADAAEPSPAERWLPGGVGEFGDEFFDAVEALHALFLGHGVGEAAEAFSFEGLSSDKVTAHLLVTPQQEDWHLENTGEAFMDTFKPGESISVVLKAGDNFYLPETEIAVMYVIRDAEGNVLPKLISRETRIWKDIWYAGNYHNGELTIPEVPADPGQYTVDIYFNSKIMASAKFTVSE